jgi:hypothetical protein
VEANLDIPLASPEYNPLTKEELGSNTLFSSIPAITEVIGLVKVS